VTTRSLRVETGLGWAPTWVLLAFVVGAALGTATGLWQVLPRLPPAMGVSGGLPAGIARDALVETVPVAVLAADADWIGRAGTPAPWDLVSWTERVGGLAGGVLNLTPRGTLGLVLPMLDVVGTAADPALPGSVAVNGVPPGELPGGGSRPPGGVGGPPQSTSGGVAQGGYAAGPGGRDGGGEYAPDGGDGPPGAVTGPAAPLQGEPDGPPGGESVAVVGRPRTWATLSLATDRPEDARVALYGDGDPLVAVYHTHSREGFLPELDAAEVERLKGAYSDDLDRTVVRCGRALAAALARLEVPAVLSERVHDREGRIGAYVRSEATVKALLRAYPSLRLLLDLHRDSQGRDTTTVTLVGGQPAARLLLVVGKKNPHFEANYALALRLVRLAESEYPGLTRGIFPKRDRYNQHLSPYAALVELGGIENTMEEAVRSARLLAQVVALELRDR